MTIIDTIKELFKDELDNTAMLYPEHDPFMGHRPEDKQGGKSKFYDGTDGWLEPHWAERLDEETSLDGNTKFVTVKVVGVDTEEGICRGMEHYMACGEEVKTIRTNYGGGNVIVKTIYWCKQLVGAEKEWEETHETVGIATVILCKENGVWIVATAFPGERGIGPEQLSSFEEGEELVFDRILSDGKARFWKSNGDEIELDIAHVVIEEENPK